jgi:hypothetical protein
MPEKTKPHEVNPKEKGAEESFSEAEENNRSKAQLEKSYYYDDAHGYEIYNPDEDEDESEEG